MDTRSSRALLNLIQIAGSSVQASPNSLESACTISLLAFKSIVSYHLVLRHPLIRLSALDPSLSPDLVSRDSPGYLES